MAVRGEREGGEQGTKGGGLIWSWRGLLAGTAGGMVLAVATESQTLRRCQVLAATAAAEEDEGKAA